MNLKQIFFSGILLAVILFSCDKEDENFQSSGLITGPDIRECICCGGYFIEIEDSTYNFDSLPESSGIDLSSETFPVAVKLDWDMDRTCGDIKYINIIRIKKN